MEKRCIGLLGLCLLVALSFMLSAGPPAYADSIIYADADTFVSEGSKNSVLNEQGITIKSQNTLRRFGYITFTFESQPVAEAYMMLFQTGNWNDGDPPQLKYRWAEAPFYTFDETTLTWNTRPDLNALKPDSEDPVWSAEANAFKYRVGARKYWAWNITDLYNSNLGKTITFHLFITDGPNKNVGVTFEDKEGSRFADPGSTYDAPGAAYPYIHTLSVADTTAPSVPTNLQATGVAWDKIQLTWNTSTDNVAVDRYKVYRNGVEVTTPKAANTIFTGSFVDSGLTANDSYTYTVSAIDYAGNESAQSSSAVAIAKPPDTSAPSVPDGLDLRVSCSSIGFSWNASTDDVGVVGYKIKKDGVEVADVTTTFYTESNVEVGQTYTYSVSAYDFAGNYSAEASEEGTIPPCFEENEIKFNFSDGGDSVYTYTSDPNIFFTSADGDAAINHWFGKRIMGKDGSVSWQNYFGDNNYRFAFSDDNGGSLTIQTATPVGEGGEKNASANIRTNDFGNWWKWSNGENYYRGVKIDVDMDIVGDLHGWCAPWGDFPAIGECEWTNDYWHQGSDWGSQHGLRAGLYVTIASGRQLPDPLAPEDTNISTGDGCDYWFTVRPGNLRDANDDLVSIFSSAQYDHATFRFKDGLGFGLVPEDGVVGPARDGVITGTGNKMKLTVAVVNAGGNSEYWDIWVTRPNGDKVHINPATCDWVMSAQNQGNYGWFGLDGHTFGSTYQIKGSGNINSVALGQDTMNMIFGTKFNSLTIRNDWDGEVTVPIEKLGDIHKLGVGTRVTIDATGGEKVVTLDPTCKEMMAPYFFFIEQEDRSAGVMVLHNEEMPMASKGQQVTSLVGVISRNNEGNLYIDITNGSIELDTATKAIEPVGMNNLTVGGNVVTAGRGVVNTGILATVWGKIVSQWSDLYGNVYFELDDGSGTPIEVVDLSFDGFTVNPLEGEYWTATGPIAIRTILYSKGPASVAPEDPSAVRVIYADNARKVN